MKIGFTWFTGLDPLTIVLGVVALGLAAVSFTLNRLEFIDGRKRILGFRIKSLKLFFTYATLILAVITVLLQAKTESNKSITELTNQRRTDSVQKANLDTTLRGISQTLKLQARTLDSVNRVLFDQKKELRNQIDIIAKQEKTLFGNGIIIKSQKEAVENLTDVVYNTDPIYNLTLKIFWTKHPVDTEFTNQFNHKVELKDTSIISVESDGFIIKQPSIKEFSYCKVDIFFLKKDIDTTRIAEMFFQDTLNINRRAYKISMEIYDFYLKKLNPDLTVSSGRITNESSLLYLRRDNELLGNYWMEASVDFAQGKKNAFSNLKDLWCLVVWKSMIDEADITELSIKNYDKTRALKLKLASLLYRKRMKTEIWGNLNQKVYLAKIKELSHHDK